MAKAKTVEVVVSVDDAHAGKVGEVAAGLAAAGLTAATVQAALGTVAGRVDPAKLPALRKVPGVQAVEESRTVGPAGG